MSRFDRDEEMGIIYNTGASAFRQKRYGEYSSGENEDPDEAITKIYNPNSVAIHQARYGDSEQQK